MATGRMLRKKFIANTGTQIDGEEQIGMKAIRMPSRAFAMCITIP
jgi:hypothetical protein